VITGLIELQPGLEALYGIFRLVAREIKSGLAGDFPKNWDVTQNDGQAVLSGFDNG
jgi:hypothetical protein